MKIFNHTIDAHHDFELHNDVLRKIDYSICIPNRDIEGVVIYIAGFGDDTKAYRTNFQKYICKNYSMACLTVDYHCFFQGRITAGL